MLFADNSRGKDFAKDPAVINFNGSYFMYYSMGRYTDNTPDRTWVIFAIGIAKSDNLLEWEKVGEIVPETDFEKNGICAPGALVINGKVHLFYQTYGNGTKDAICHTVSKDGINFKKNEHNPIFYPTGDWNCGRAIDADVVIHNDKVLLYFATRDAEFVVQMIGVAVAYLADNFDKNSFKLLHDAPILKPELEWEKKCIEAPALCKHNNELIMFYGGGYNNEPQQIGCARSKDGIVWERIYDYPIVPNGNQGEWNSSESGHPFAFTDNDGQVYLFYQGNNDNGNTWYLSMVKIGWEDNKPIVI